MNNIVRFAKPFALDDNPKLVPTTHQVAVTFDDGFYKTMHNVIPELNRRNIPVTIFIPTGCLGQRPNWIADNGSLDYSDVVMSAEYIKEIQKNRLISFGSHCVNHGNLLCLDEKGAEVEIFKSKSDLENILGEEIKFLSFPYGVFSQGNINCARRAGYQRIFSIQPTLAFLHPDEYVAGRVRVDPKDWSLEFRLKILGAYRWLPAASYIKRKIRKLYTVVPD
jgi:peptidoglycan/xylan/chitin deacetylase (PgdA/CDA1 family)